MEKRMLLPAEVCEETIKTGIKKTKNDIFQTIILAIMAGAFIAIGGFASSAASHSIKNVGLSKLVSGAIFPVGLILILICGAELFTGNTLLSIALIERRITLKGLLKNWTLVYVGNLIGTLIIAFIIFEAGLFATNFGLLGGYAIKVAANKGGLTFGTAFASGILCNFVVCLAVWGASAAKDVVGKIFMAWFPIMAFVISGFEHSVANMYYFSSGMLAKLNPEFVKASGLSSEKLANVDLIHAVNNLIPVTLGNIIGGAVFVGAAYWIAYKHAPSIETKFKATINNN
ncbi:formate/nitrite transporter family protein [Fonticella tunisiensis]|uniref:Formate/nitrite transporter n=1 Tax=Fonticella tunisiensis TaxID=1096341 RepID=A0A4R7KRC8_9CLOT|nr:formate/nitrite transporter family protein [Fonticella tunisiensis]TDT61163.1 formate/nitrite transporter [Fonticella tunisiensis]